MLSSSPAWLVRATSVLLERGDPLAPAHHLGATTSGPAPEVGCLDQQTGPHPHTGPQRQERRRKAARAPPSRVSGPQAPLLHAAGSLSRLSAKNSVSSARNDPVLTARGLRPQGRQAGHALCGPLAPGSRGAHPHACSRSQRGFMCDTWVTEGAGDRLVRGEVLPLAPGPLLRLPGASQRGQQAVASMGHTRAHVLPS